MSFSLMLMPDTEIANPLPPSRPNTGKSGTAFWNRAKGDKAAAIAENYGP
jgi:hypothetical protein